jgi:autotransporter-associated beta strand protein
MALGNFFSQFSLRALSKRFTKRLGSTLKRRFLRPDVQRRRARFEQLEDRSLMTVTTNFTAGTLTVSLDTAGDTATIIGNSAAGTGIDVQGTGIVPGQASFTGVTQLVVQDIGGVTNENVTFQNTVGKRINISGAINVTGIDTVNFANTQTIGAQSLSIGTVTNGTITFQTGINLNTISTTGTQTYGNPITLLDDVGLAAGSTGVSLLDVGLNPNNLTITGPGNISGAITGTGGLIKSGTGTLSLTGTTANTYSGLTTVNAGELDLNKTTALAVGGDLLILGGTVANLASEQIVDTSTVTVNGGFLLFNNTNLTETIGALSINGGTVLGGNAIINVNGDLVLTGGTLFATSNTLSVAGNWSKTGGTFLPGAGTVLFTGSSVQTVRSGGTAFNTISFPGTGTLKLLDTLTSPGVFTTLGGTLDLNGQTANLNTFSLQGGTVSTSVAGGKLVTTNAYDLQSGTISAALTGAVGVNKTTAGTVILSGANTYTGPTLVSDGTLEIDGSVTSNVTVTTPGSLIGIGTVNGSVTGNGTFSPGNATPGTMHITGDFTPTGNVVFLVNSPYLPANAGKDYDQYIVDGNVDLSAATLTFPNTLDTTPPLNNALLTIVSKTSAGPTTPSTNPADGTALTNGSRTFVIFYNAGDGNNVVLQAKTPVVSISVAPTSVSEIGTTNLVYTFTRDLTPGAFPINFTISGTATPNVDYVASSSDSSLTFSGTSGTITFADGSPTATLTIDPTPDKLLETNETVILTIIPGTNYRSAASPNNTATGTITDNSITGIVYRDLHGVLSTDPPDGVREPDEPVVPGVVVYLDLNNDGKLGITEPAVQVDNYGHYTFPNVSAGTFTLRELPTPGLGGITQPLTPDGSYLVFVPDGQLANLDFGNGTGSATDYGDAPDGTSLPNGVVAHYGTLLANNGARAGLLANFHLGALEDGEADGQPSSDAKGDDTHGLADEDGVQIQVLPQGGSISVPVTVTNGSNGAGKLSAWIDLNQDGIFESNERVIANRVMSSGTTSIPITIPGSAVLGPTFARFRYGYETDIGPTGPALAGEVEDYQVLILPGNGAPTAVPDTFPDDNPPELTAVQGGVIKPTSMNFHLDVLGNDIGGINSFGGQLTISAVTPPSPGGGTLTIVSDATLGRDVLSYTPGPGVASGSDQTFTYQIEDALGNKSTFTTDTIHIALGNNQAIDDTFTVQVGNQLDGTTHYEGLPAMQNDLTPYAITPTLPAPNLPTDKRPVIIAVGTLDPGDATSTPKVPPPPDGQNMAVYIQPGTGLTATLSINQGNSQTLDITADAGFVGTALFKYEINEDPSNDDLGTDPSTRFVTVQIVNGVVDSTGSGIGGASGTAQITAAVGDLIAAHYLAALKTTVVAADAGGNPTNSPTIVHKFDTFYLRVDARDLRDIPLGGTATDRGVQAAFLDMLLNPGDTGLPFRTYAQPVPDDQANPMTAIHFANAYPAAQNGQNGVDGAPKAGEFNEVGASQGQGSVGLGTDYNTVFYVKMIASKETPGVAGQRQSLVVALDPADIAGNDVLLKPTDVGGGNPQQLTDDQVFFQPTSFPILAPGEAEFTNAANPRDVDGDGSVTASDVLSVINNINAQGSRSLVGQTPSANSAMVDVNMDSHVTSIDVLTVINFINSFFTSHRAPTAPAGNSAAGDASLSQLSSPTGTQTSSSTSSSTPTLLTGGTSSSSNPSSSSSSPTTSGSTTTQTSTSTSGSKVDPAAADDIYGNMSTKQQILNRFGR